jgi:hypothetical protein
VPPFLTGLTPSSRREPAALARQELPPRVKLAAGAAVAAIVVQAAIAQVTLGLAVVFTLAAALSRWRPIWLLGPAVAGLAWIAVVGPGDALHGYLAGAGHLASVLTTHDSLAGRLRGLRAVTTDWRHWLPAQFPVALVVAAAEAGVASRPAGRGRPRRPGPAIVARRCYVMASLRRGEVATADGGCLGVVTAVGRRAAVTWREAEGGVLVTGADSATVTSTCRDLAAAAILHRKSVLIVDLTGGGIAHAQRGRSGAETVRASVAAACEDAAAPLAIFGAGRCCYEPFSEAGPAGGAELVAAMLDWSEAGQAGRALCADYARTVLAVIAANARQVHPASPRPRTGVLDDLAAMLTPGALARRLRQESWASPDAALERHVAALDGRLHADPAAAAAIAAQLGTLRRSAFGAQLCQAPSGTATSTIRLSRALAERQVVLFPLDAATHGAAAAMTARLVIADLARVLAGRGGVPADCLVWVNGCDVLGARPAVAGGDGPRAGVATVLGTGSAEAARALAGAVNVVAVRGRPPRGMASQAPPPGYGPTAPAGQPALAGESSLTHQNDHVLPAALLAASRADALSLLVRGPAPRLISGCQVAR